MINKKNNNAGLTMIEVLVVMAIVGLIIVAVYQFIITSSQSQRFAIEQATAIYDAQNSLESTVQEIREAADGDDGSWPIELADDHELIIYSDIDSDTETERIRYYLDGTEFKKETIEPTGFPIRYTDDPDVKTLSYHIQNGATPIFSYYGDDYPIESVDPLDTPADVTETNLIHIHLELNVYPQRQPETISIDSDVHIRNLKTNL